MWWSRVPPTTPKTVRPNSLREYCCRNKGGVNFHSSSQRYSGLKDWISQYVRKDDNILMVGCGNSRLSEDMFDDGFTTLTNIDVSRVVIDQMAARYRYTVYSVALS